MAGINDMIQQHSTPGPELEPTMLHTSEFGQQPIHISSNALGPILVDSSRLELIEEPIQASGPKPAHELEHEPQEALGPEPTQDLMQTLEPPTQQPTEGRGPTQTPEPDNTQESTSDPSQDPVNAMEQAIGQEFELTQEEALQQERGPERAVVMLNLPRDDLLKDDRRRDFMDICVPLYEASINGDWEVALGILNKNNEVLPDLLKYGITENCETMLHVAASAQNTNFVRNLVCKMQYNDDDLLKYQNKSGNTALCLAAITGNVDIAKIMVDRNKELLAISNKAKMIPLYIAALYGKRDMVNYLYIETNKLEWTDENKKWVYIKCVEAGVYVTALQIFKDHKELAQTETQHVLGVLARKPSAFDETNQHIMRRIFNSNIACFKVRPDTEINEAIQLLRNILTSYRDRPMNVIDKILRGPPGTLINNKRTYPSRILFIAAEMGNTKFIVELIRQYPDLIWKQNDKKQSIFHIAVSHRHQSIYNLLYEIGSMKDLIVILMDPDHNNMLHLVGKMVNKSRLQDVSGAAFQMQRELLWYKEVESMIPHSYRERKNKFGETPNELFTKTHKDLVYEGEKWMRGTASKCMLVATLVATIVFGIAYTVPGGYNETNGYPVFLRNGPFIVFVILDAISLILSSTSILVFLSILTSRYTQEDFIESLPKKLIVGLSMLFLSIMTMMIAFSVSFFVLYRHKFVILAGFISLIALTPIIAYAKLHYPLLVDVFRSTYGSRYLFKPKQRMLYYQNPRS